MWTHRWWCTHYNNITYHKLISHAELNAACSNSSIWIGVTILKCTNSTRLPIRIHSRIYIPVQGEYYWLCESLSRTHHHHTHHTRASDSTDVLCLYKFYTDWTHDVTHTLLCLYIYLNLWYYYSVFCIYCVWIYFILIHIPRYITLTYGIIYISLVYIDGII